MTNPPENYKIASKLVSFDDVNCILKIGNALSTVRKHGFHTIRFNHKKKRIEIYSHVLIWYMANKKMPSSQLIFLDGDKTNFRITNLVEKNGEVEYSPPVDISIKASDLENVLNLLENSGIKCVVKNVTAKKPKPTFEIPCQIGSLIYCEFIPSHASYAP